MVFKLKIQDRAQMQFARGGMSVMHSGEIVTAEDLVELTHVSRHIFRVDGGILNHSHWFCISRYVRQQAQCGFAQVPYAILVCAPYDRIVVAKAGSA